MLRASIRVRPIQTTSSLLCEPVTYPRLLLLLICVALPVPISLFSATTRPACPLHHGYRDPVHRNFKFCCGRKYLTGRTYSRNFVVSLLLACGTMSTKRNYA